MYGAAFDYSAPATLEEAIDLLVTHGSGAKVLAGGQSLIPLMKLRLASPAHIVDIARIPGLEGVGRLDGWLRIGAMTREAEVEHSALLAQHYPILADASRMIADPSVRNLGTLGGNLAHADPANDHPAVMVAIGAQVVARGRAGERTIPIDTFFRDLFETALDPAEILTEIRVPVPPPGTGTAYVKLERQVGDYALAAAAARVRVVDGTIAEAALVFTNLGEIAIRAADAERMLVGLTARPESLDEPSRAATSGLAPWADLRGSPEVKVRVAAVVARRALGLALDRALAATSAGAGA